MSLTENNLSFYSEIYKTELVGYNDYIMNYVQQKNKLWEEKLCNLIVDNIKNNSEFIDIGANIGLKNKYTLQISGFLIK